MAKAIERPDGFYTVVLRDVAFHIPNSCIIVCSAHYSDLTCPDPIPGSSAGRRVDAQHTLTIVGNDLDGMAWVGIFLLQAAYETLGLGGRAAYVFSSVLSFSTLICSIRRTPLRINESIDPNQ